MEDNHKGKECIFDPTIIVCQEGYCAGCEIARGEIAEAIKEILKKNGKH